MIYWCGSKVTRFCYPVNVKWLLEIFQSLTVTGSLRGRGLTKIVSDGTWPLKHVAHGEEAGFETQEAQT